MLAIIQLERLRTPLGKNLPQGQLYTKAKYCSNFYIFIIWNLLENLRFCSCVIFTEMNLVAENGRGVVDLYHELIFLSRSVISFCCCLGVSLVSCYQPQLALGPVFCLIQQIVLAECVIVVDVDLSTLCHSISFHRCQFSLERFPHTSTVTLVCEMRSSGWKIKDPFSN